MLEDNDDSMDGGNQKSTSCQNVWPLSNVSSIPVQEGRQTYKMFPALYKMNHSNLCEQTIHFWCTRTGAEDVLNQLDSLQYGDIPTKHPWRLNRET